MGLIGNGLFRFGAESAGVGMSRQAGEHVVDDLGSEYTKSLKLPLTDGRAGEDPDSTTPGQSPRVPRRGRREQLSEGLPETNLSPSLA